MTGKMSQYVIKEKNLSIGVKNDCIVLLGYISKISTINTYYFGNNKKSHMRDELYSFQILLSLFKCWRTLKDWLLSVAFALLCSCAKSWEALSWQPWAVQIGLKILKGYWRSIHWSSAYNKMQLMHHLIQLFTVCLLSLLCAEGRGGGGARDAYGWFFTTLHGPSGFTIIIIATTHWNLCQALGEAASYISFLTVTLQGGGDIMPGFWCQNWGSKKVSTLPEATKVVSGASKFQSMLFKSRSLRLQSPYHCITQCQNVFRVQQWVQQWHAACQERAGEERSSGAACWQHSTFLQRSLPEFEQEHTDELRVSRLWLSDDLGGKPVVLLDWPPTQHNPFSW